jgi:hypothetical protein
MRLPLLLAALLLVSCSQEAPRVANRTPAERAVLAEKKLAVPPVPRTYPVGQNELVVVDVPVADGQHFVDRQRCFIYRDAEFKQSTMSCGQQPDTLVVAP